MSIRLRLTLLYSSILALTLVIFSIALYAILARSVYTALHTDLAEEAQRFNDPRAIQGIHRGPPPRFAAPESYYQILNPEGGVTNRSPNLGEITLPLSPAALQAVQNGKTWGESVNIEGQTLYVYSAPLSFQGRLMGYVQIGRGMAEQEGSLGALRRILMAGIVLATLIAFGIGWGLAGTALRPINKITQTAQAIGAEHDFDRRVQHSGPNDELGRLATTFNQMLSELQTAYRQMEESLQAQRRFVADASHELRTPLTTIRGNLGLLQRKPAIETEDQIAVLDDLVSETERMMRLVQSLLTLARVDAGQGIRHEEVAVKPIMEDIARHAQVLAPDRRIIAAPLEDVEVIAERDMLKQVMLILTDNAIKYTPVGGQIILATTIENGHVALSVRDTGMGIPPATLPHIFKRFYRTDSARTGDGAGLGLSIAKSLVEAYQGAIAVDSEVGKGSVFTVTLPRAPGE